MVNGATPLQQNAGDAIETLCLTLPGPSLTAASALGDLNRRCTELVASSITVRTGTPNGFSLGVGKAQILGDVQQLAGEELSTPGRLVTQAPAAQFSNISGRLNALRLGGFNALSRGTLFGICAQQRG